MSDRHAVLHRLRCDGVAVLAAVVPRAGCAALSTAPDTAPAGPESAHDRSARYGAAVDDPSRMWAARAFEPDHLLGRRWNPDAATDMTGERWLADPAGANVIARGVMRIGVNRALAAVAASAGRRPARAALRP